MRTLKRTLPIFLLLLLVAGTVHAELVSKIAAIVNDDIITTHQLDLKLAEYFANEARGRKIPPQQIAALREKLLDRMIDQVLVKQQIKSLGLTVSDAEIDQAIADVQRKNKLTREQLSKALEAQGMSYDAYREKLRAQLLQYKLIGRQVQSKIDVTDTDIRLYFRSHIDDYREPPFVKLANLLFPLPQHADDAQIAEVRQRAAQALARLRAGEDFSVLLKELEASGQAQGGEMGRFKEGELSGAIREALAGLKTGDYSSPVQTLAGFLIFKVVDRTPGHIRNFDQVKAEIKQKLVDEDRERQFKKWTTTLKKDSYIDIRI
ncbi:SurA N-terminal domain-containing protein [Geothermobacter hydrogeniphilus]|uniref:PpiC domain-containing protein n=1 Tax=Geothermobacter hydrogeniphilus TaxID=1969733 RepID=A0A1X0XZL7_9BACT|nr:SurA N-terminal domain-containing protein [Geothermobacter hydrogeniphilus]ORJ58282.1 hypothetical protein B5V00_12540 [Geothermobacter hydrogeniphilus]